MKKIIPLLLALCLCFSACAEEAPPLFGKQAKASETARAVWSLTRVWEETYGDHRLWDYQLHAVFGFQCGYMASHTDLVANRCALPPSDVPFPSEQALKQAELALERCFPMLTESQLKSLSVGSQYIDADHHPLKPVDVWYFAWFDARLRGVCTACVEAYSGHVLYVNAITYNAQGEFQEDIRFDP